MAESSQPISSVSFIIEQNIPPNKTQDFLEWEKEINKVCCQFKGYIKTVNCPSNSEIKNKWYTIIYFDTAENLTNWLDSEERYHLVKARKDKLGFYSFIGYKTGLEEWFNSQKNLPRWKQALSVLFGLYPVVMSETILFSAWQIMDSWLLTWRILFANTVSCFLLTWIVMPLVRKLFNFWLNPHQNSLKINWLGASLIIIGLIFMVSFFTMIIQI